MGKLRIEPKKRPQDPMEQRQIASILREAYENSDEYDYFWNLDVDEDRSFVRQQFEDIASREDIPLKIRVLRKNRRFHLVFRKQNEARGSKFQLERYKNKIIAILRSVGKPMSKKEILVYGQLAGGRWRSATLALKESGVLLQDGNTRNLLYSLAPVEDWRGQKYSLSFECDEIMSDTDI